MYEVCRRELGPHKFTLAVALTLLQCSHEPGGGRSTTVAPATLALPSYRPHLAAEPTRERRTEGGGRGGKNHFELLLTDKLRAGEGGRASASAMPTIEGVFSMIYW